MKEKFEHHIFTSSEAWQGFTLDFLDDDICRHWILTHLHRTGAACPHCRQKVQGEKNLNRFWLNMRIRCTQCSRYYRASSKTFLERAEKDYRWLFFIAAMIGAGVSDRQIAERLDADPQTVKKYRRIFEAFEGILDEKE